MQPQPTFLVNWAEEYRLMIPEHLDSVELAYELRVRGVTGLRTRVEMRNALRGFLKEVDPESSVVLLAIDGAEADIEVQMCEHLLQSLRDAVEDEPGEATRHQLRSRVVHLINRLARVERLVQDNGALKPLLGEAIALGDLIWELARAESSEEGSASSVKQVDSRLGATSLPTGRERVNNSHEYEFDQDDTMRSCAADPKSKTKEYQDFGGARPKDRGSRSLSGELSQNYTRNFQVGHKNGSTPIQLEERKQNPPSSGFNREKPACGFGAKEFSWDDTRRTYAAGTEAVSGMAQTSGARPKDLGGRSQSDNANVFRNYMTSFHDGLEKRSNTVDAEKISASPQKHKTAEESGGAGGIDSTIGSILVQEIRTTHRLLQQLLSRSEMSAQAPTEEHPARLRQPEPSMRPLGERDYRMPITKWPIEKFDGREEEWPRFLAKLEQLAMAENTEWDEIFDRRIHLFTGEALDWVLTANLRNWDHLKVELTKFVFGARSDLENLQRISTLRQEGESAAVFINRMELRFRSLTVQPWEEEKVEIIMKGLRSELRSLLAANLGISTMDQLRAAAARLERINGPVIAVEAFGPNSHQNRRRPGNRVIPSREPQASGTSYAEPQTKPVVFCYRCGVVGHISRGCSNPPKVICTGCGREGQLRDACPHCRPSESGN